MRILQVEAGRHLYGGALQVLYLVRGLAKRGVDNVLVAPTGSAIADAAERYATVQRVSWGGDADVGAVWRILGAIRRHRPDIVHLHSRRGADLFGVLAARMAGVPAIVTRRVDNPEPGWMSGPKYRLAERVIAISEGIREVLRRAGVSERRLVTVHSAVDTAAYSGPCDLDAFRRELELPEGAFTIGVVAQLIERKGHRYLLDVLPPLLDSHPQLQVILFGRGPLESELRGRVGVPPLAGRVRLAGFRDDLPALMPCLDLVVHPADTEGLGVSLLQAAAAGVPVIASRVGGIPEAVRDGENGLLVPPGDRGALGDAIGRLIADDSLRERLGAAGRVVARGFSVEAMVEGNLAVYRDLLGDGAGAGARA